VSARAVNGCGRAERDGFTERMTPAAHDPDDLFDDADAFEEELRAEMSARGFVVVG
jgi:hypothetical protein